VYATGDFAAVAPHSILPHILLHIRLHIPFTTTAQACIRWFERDFFINQSSVIPGLVLMDYYDTTTRLHFSSIPELLIKLHWDNQITGSLHYKAQLNLVVAVRQVNRHT
jgi:hypothetical protein